MRTPRFNNRFDQRPATRWTRLSNFSEPRVCRRKKFFAVVSPPMMIGASRKPIRRVLIYDNHPATLRLLHDVDLGEERKTNWRILAGAAFAIVIVLGILWLVL
jgi:hypothetical protein